MRVCFAFLLTVICAARLPAADLAIWSDKSLPVSDGLELWLDATRENEAREAYLMNRLRSGDAMELWHDSSGHLRHATQWETAARPQWRSDNGGPGVWFAGDGFLAALVTPPVAFKEATVFVVAAPAKTQGPYAGLFSATRRGADDFRSGLNIDLGSKAAKQWAAVNVEGSGQSGERNLLATPVEFGAGHVLALRSMPGENGTTLRMDGHAQGARSRSDVAWAMDMFAVGARLVGGPPAIQHHFNGGIAEVLVYGRRLDDAQVAKMEAWLAAKHAAFLRGPDVTVPTKIASATDKDAPIVQMLAPGFTVRELPVEITALNNIEYAADGRLFAGGYDGRFHVLRDTDGDGLEDKADTFSAATTDNFPLGMAVKDGDLYALLANEIVRFRDTKGSGVPDLRETMVKDWDDPVLQKDPLLHHRRVDSAIGFAIGKDGEYYATMGSAAYTNGYWVDKGGKPHYSTDKLRGCLLRITPDGHVENLASGLRYVISMQWNRYGDLFATDQEGATWLPNGNPLDELLYLEKGHHYGFPPRHPKWLPNVVDEPSVWDYAPQHQSTCGFRFNGPQKDRARFGPEFWNYDAFVTGESRGKIWRTSLAKTEAGYVAQTQLIACLGMLTVDCAISPKGDLVVCCHAGPPDWGKGPSAIGKLFKISLTDPAAPQPALAWAASPTKTIVAFDKPLDASWQEGPELAQRVRIEFGRFVSAADRFETIRPGYAVISQVQQREPRFELPVKEAHLGADRRSVVIETAPRKLAVNYAMTLADTRAPETDPRAIPQKPAMDLAFELTGVAADWRGADGSAWSGWLPHPDFIAAREFTRGSAVHEAFWQKLTQPGELTLHSQLNLWNMLHPAVQPGSKLDYEPEAENVTVVFKSDAALKLATPPGPGVQIQRISDHESRLAVTNVRESVWPSFTLTLASPARTLDVSYFTTQDLHPRAPGTRRFYLPFATPPGPLASAGAIPEVAGGNWENGHTLFKTKAACITCHAIRGEGVGVGPDLSNLIHRDYASVMKDIVDPNASVNPDAVGYTVTLKDGSAFIGTRAGETAEELQLAQPGGAIAKIRKADITRNEPMAVSLMPVGLLQALSPQEVKDLMTFLLTKPAGAE